MRQLSKFVVLGLVLACGAGPVGSVLAQTLTGQDMATGNVQNQLRLKSIETQLNSTQNLVNALENCGDAQKFSAGSTDCKLASPPDLRKAGAQNQFLQIEKDHNGNYVTGPDLTGADGTKTTSGAVQYTLWGDWDTCSTACGGGTQTRTRDCVNAAASPVACTQCGGDCSESRTCNTESCNGPKLRWAYSGWGACTPDECGSYRERTVTCVDENGTSYPKADCNKVLDPPVVCDYSISCGNNHCPSARPICMGNILSGFNGSSQCAHTCSPVPCVFGC